MAMTAPVGLAFAHSETRTVGVLTSLKKIIPERIRELCHKERQLELDNSARIVGGMKLAGDMVIGLSMNPFLIGYSVFAITGRLIMLTWGSKAHQKKLAEEKEDGQHDLKLGHSLKDNDRKILHPRLYPIEAAAGFSTIAESFGIGYGLWLMAAGQPWITPIVLGAIAIYSYGSVVFKKEKSKEEVEAKEKAKSDPLTFAKSDSKTAGATGRLRTAMKSSPVFTSSLINLGISVFMLVGGYLEKNLPYMQAAPIFIAANLLSALLVRKNDYNLEGATQLQTDTPPSATFQERVAASKGRGGDLYPRISGV